MSDDDGSDAIHTKLLHSATKLNLKDNGDDDDDDKMNSHFKMFLMDALKSGKKTKY